MSVTPADIVILDDSLDLCQAIGQLIQLKLGKSCLALGSYEDLVRNRSDVLSTRLAILDVNLGENQPNGLDAFKWLRSAAYAGEIFFFTGHARNNPLLAEVAKAGVPVLTKPMPSAELISLIEVALRRQTPAGR